jgi:ATP-dependent Lon protease
MVETRSQKRKIEEDEVHQDQITAIIKKRCYQQTEIEESEIEEYESSESEEQETLETEETEELERDDETEIKNLVKAVLKRFIKENKTPKEETCEDEYEEFNHLVESIHAGEFFERVPLEEKRDDLVKKLTLGEVKELNKQLYEMQENYQNNSPSIIDILRMKCTMEQKQKLLEKVHHLVNSEVLSAEYNSNLKFLTSNISNESDPSLLELEEKILKSAVNSGIFDSYKNKILKSKMSFENKVIAYKKLEIMETYEETDTSEYAKYKNWMDSLLSVPFGSYDNIPITIESSKEELQNYICSVRKTLDKKLSFLEKPKDQIINIVSQMIRNPDCNINAIGLHGKKGVGKCHGFNTPILMFDGSIKMVQDIRVGDLLMGDDSTPRKVLSLATGQEEMFEIQHTLHDESYIVNKSHILTLKMSDNKNINHRKERSSYVVTWFDTKTFKKHSKSFNYSGFRNGNNDKKYAQNQAKKLYDSINDNKIVDIPLETFLSLNQTIRTRLQGFKVGVEFKERELDFDPYIVGYWLGDGTSSSSGITTQDSVVLYYLSKTLPKYNCYLQYQNNNSSKYSYRINGNSNSNVFWNTLKKYDLVNNKHIPNVYKINSRENRLKLLAGLLDSDGSLNSDGCGYDFIQKNNELTDDVVYLCRSLGFQCKPKKCMKGCWYNGEYREGEYNRLYIYGKGLEDIPVLCPRKKARKRLQIKDPLVTAIKVIPKGIDNYYGFELDGNHRYLLGNFIVTHNTELCKSIAESLGRPLRTISLGGESDASTLTGHGFTYVGSNPGRFIEILRETKTMNPVILVDELDKISETHQGKEIIGTLIHLTDSTTNSKYNYDKYFSGIEFDLSKVLFIFTYNDPSKVDKILADRLYKIKVDNYSFKEKLEITNKHLVNTILEKLKIDKEIIKFSDDAIQYLVETSREDEGMRNIKTKIKIILTRINILLLTNPSDNVINLKYKELYSYYTGKETYVIPRNHIDILLNESISTESDEFARPPPHMYI